MRTPDPRASVWGELEGLAAQWQSEAEVLRRRGASDHAVLLESCARELAERVAVRGLEAELLTIEQAAALTGYSRSGMDKLVRGGKLANYGARNRPRVRRGDALRFRKPEPERAPSAGRGQTEPLPAA